MTLARPQPRLSRTLPSQSTRMIALVMLAAAAISCMSARTSPVAEAAATVTPPFAFTCACERWVLPTVPVDPRNPDSLRPQPPRPACNLEADLTLAANEARIAVGGHAAQAATFQTQWGQEVRYKGIGKQLDFVAYELDLVVEAPMLDEGKAGRVFVVSADDGADAVSDAPATFRCTRKL